MRFIAPAPFAYSSIPARACSVVIVAGRHRADAGQVGVGQPGLLRPGIELGLDPGQILFRAWLLRDVETGFAQARHHVARRHEAVPADDPQKILTGVPSEPGAAFGQQFEQAEMIVQRPGRQQPAEAAVLARDVGHEPRVMTHGHDLLGVPYDAGIADEPLPELVRLEQQPFRLEPEEGGLEGRPFVVDDAPDKAGAEDPLGHLGQHPVVVETAQHGRARYLVEERSKGVLPALALGRTRPDRRERLHESAAVPVQSALINAASLSSIGRISSRGLGGSINTTLSTPASR
jgi:hypothetical protein